MKLVKNTAIIIIGLVLSAVITFISLQFYVRGVTTPDQVKSVLTDIVQDNFRKAVKFDSVEINSMGAISITNLKISVSDDFNDNIYLIDAPAVVINLRFLPLIQKKVDIHYLEFKQATVTIHKKFDATYEESIQAFANIHALFRSSEQLSGKNAKVKFKDSVLTYSEFFENDAFMLSLTDVDADISLTTGSLIYSLTGNIKEDYLENTGENQLQLAGELYYDSEGNPSGDTHVILNSFDLSRLNTLIKNKFENHYEIDGTVSIDSTVGYYKDSYSINFKADTVKLTLDEISRLFSRRRFINNLDFSLDLNADYFSPGSFIIHDSYLDLYDNQILVNGEYTKTDVKEMISGNVQSNVLDLSNISGKIYPGGNNISLAGETRLKSSIQYDVKNKVNYNTSVQLTLSDCSAVLNETDKSTEIFSSLNGKVELTESAFESDTQFNINKSDVNLSILSNISNWNPISTETEITLNSTYLNSLHVVKSIKLFHDFVETEARKDSLDGYDGVFFPEQPYGKVMVNNNILFNANVEKLGVGRDAVLKNVVLVQSLKDRELDTEQFNAEGFEGEYSFRLRANLKNEFVRFTTSAKASNVDLAYWFRDAGYEGSAGGILNVDYEWQTNGFRLKHLLFQSDFDFSATVLNGNIGNTAFNRHYSDFLSSCKNNADVSNIDFRRASFGIKRNSVNYYVRPLVIDSNELRINSRGVYLYNEGFNIPFTATVKTADSETSQSSTQVKLRIRGLFDEARLYCHDDESRSIGIFELIE
jgi:hypothetical protein